MVRILCVFHTFINLHYYNQENILYNKSLKKLGLKEQRKKKTNIMLSDQTSPIVMDRKKKKIAEGINCQYESLLIQCVTIFNKKITLKNLKTHKTLVM